MVVYGAVHSSLYLQCTSSSHLAYNNIWGREIPVIKSCTLSAQQDRDRVPSISAIWGVDTLAAEGGGLFILKRTVSRLVSPSREVIVYTSVDGWISHEHTVTAPP